MKTTPDFPKKSLANRMIIISCLAATLGLVACQQEGSAEKTGQKIDKAVDNVGQKIEQTTEKAGAYIEESADTADDDLEKARQAIDKAINNTGKQLAGAEEAAVDAASTTGEFIDDSVITTQIKAAMINDEFLKASAIEVTTVNGVVTLKGTLDSEQLVSRAIGLANSQQGVKSVQNELMINSSVPSKQ